MRNAMRFFAIMLLMVLAASFVGCSKQSEETNKPDETVKLNIATGNENGSFNDMGQALSVILKKQMIDLTVTETNGSLENIDLLLQNRADMGISMLDVAKGAYDRPKTSDAAIGTDLRVMMALYPNVIQIITTDETQIKTFQDLKYKRVGVGSENSGVEWSARLVFEAHGMTYNDCKVEMVGATEAVALMQEGKLDAAFVTGTVPNEMINEIEKDKKHKLVFIPISGLEREALIKKYSEFQKAVIPENSYGKNQAIETVSIMNVLLVNKKLEDKTVEKMLTTIEGKLTEIEAAMGSTDMVSFENLEKLTDIPLHPGAKNYFDKRK